MQTYIEYITCITTKGTYRKVIFVDLSQSYLYYNIIILLHAVCDTIIIIKNYIIVIINGSVFR